MAGMTGNELADSPTWMYRPFRSLLGPCPSCLSLQLALAVCPADRPYIPHVLDVPLVLHTVISMTFSSLRALHAIIGTAIDDMERVYRPQRSTRRPSHSSTSRSSASSSSRTTSSRFSRDSDSDVDADDADVSTPPTPTSPNLNVRFASTSGRKGRERAQTLPPLSHPTPGPLPPPILKQPPLDFPSLDTPISLRTSPNQSYNVVIANASIEIEGTGDQKNADVDGIGDSPRQKEWKKKCEDLTAHSEVIGAVNRIVAACGQLAATVQKPFLTLCDAAMGYHLPACLRFLEASHTVEMLREAGSKGMHIKEIAECISFSSTMPIVGTADGKDVDPSKLSHIMRLLATHHITREIRPDVFTNNRISSMMDSGKPWRELVGSDTPEKKYEGTEGFAAFVGLCTDELFKASAYMTDCYLPPVHTPSSISSPLVPTSQPPSVPPTPSRTDSGPNPYGIYTPNDSTVSLPNVISSPRNSTQNVTSMTFAQNPSPRGRTVSTVTVPSTPSPPTPQSTRRPRGLSFRRLSTRSTTPTPETPRSPMPLPHDPETPRSSGQPSNLYRRQGTSGIEQPAHGLNTPRSPPSRDSFQSMGSISSFTPASSTSSGSAGSMKKKSSMNSLSSIGKKASFGSIASLSMTGLAGVLGTPKKSSPPTISSPMLIRSRQASAQGYVDGHTRYAQVYAGNVRDSSARLNQVATAGDIQGQLLGPAFDLLPPSLAMSPRSRSFPGVVSGGSPASFASMSPMPPPPVPLKIHTSPFPMQSMPPPLPPKSSLRQSSSKQSIVTRVSPTQSTHAGNKSHVSSKVDSKGKKTWKQSEMHAPFNVAFNTRMRYFEWLEKEENVFRLRRFGKAMTGTGGWEVPGSVIGGFPWLELSPRSVVVDVGGGIGSTSMLLANAFPQLRFVIQDRPPVVEMGVTAWRARHPEMLENGRAVFQAHDFFKPQPPYPAELDAEKTIPPPDSEGLNVKGKDVPAVFLLRVITHDWPDSYVTRILLRLRQTAGPSTRLLLADYVLPLACVDEDEDVEPEPTESDEDLGKKVTREPLPGTVRTLAPEGSPLLPNLGKANANAYWLDLTMRVMFNAQERTLRELAALTLSAGWKIVQVTRAPGSLFGHIIAVPVDIPPENLALPTMDEPEPDLESSAQGTFEYAEMDVRNPPMGHTFLTRVDLPSEDTIRQGVAVSKAVMASNQRGRKRKGRERAYTFTGHREGSGKDSKGGSEMKKGWRSIVRMLSKPHLGGDTHGNGNPKGDKPGEAR